MGYQILASVDYRALFKTPSAFWLAVAMSIINQTFGKKLEEVVKCTRRPLAVVLSSVRFKICMFLARRAQLVVYGCHCRLRVHTYIRRPEVVIVVPCML